jgi:two-component system alkaline phosphatase synthesis response regulator PhoP
MTQKPKVTQETVLLVVDDDPAIIELVESLFEEELVVISADNGWEALALAAKHQPDMALLDLMMPGINGLTLTEELRKLPNSERLRVFIMTAHSGLKPEVERLAVRGYFPKPFEPEQLIERLLDDAHHVVRARQERERRGRK